MLYIGVIMEDGFIFGYLFQYLIFSLSFVKCAVWEYKALGSMFLSGFLVGGGLMTGELGGCSRQQIFRFINYVYAQKLA